MLVPLLWGTTFVIAKIMTEAIPILIMQGVRHFIAMLGFIPFYREIKKIDKDLAWKALITGGMNGLGMIFQTIGLQTTTAGKTGFLTALYVVLTPVFGWLFYRRAVSKVVWGAIILAMGGIFLLNFNPEELSSFLSFSLGDILILISAVFFAFQIIFTEKFIGSIDNIIGFSFMQITFVTLLCVVLIPFWPGTIRPLTITGEMWMFWLYIGLVATTLTFFLQNWGQQYVDGTQSALLFSSEPIFGVIFGFLLANEVLTWQLFLGGAMIMLASIITIKASQSNSEEQKQAK